MRVWGITNVTRHGRRARHVLAWSIKRLSFFLLFFLLFLFIWRRFGNGPMRIKLCRDDELFLRIGAGVAYSGKASLTS